MSITFSPAKKITLDGKSMIDCTVEVPSHLEVNLANGNAFAVAGSVLDRIGLNMDYCGHVEGEDLARFYAELVKMISETPFNPLKTPGERYLLARYIDLLPIVFYCLEREGYVFAWG